MTRIRSILALLTLTFCLATTAAYARDDSDAQANNPLAKVKSVNIQNLYVGNLTGLDTDANQFYLRAALPFQAFGGNWLMRATLPVNTLPTGPFLSHETGVVGVCRDQFPVLNDPSPLPPRSAAGAIGLVCIQ